jgi:CO dehydrogenase maturation factor
MKLAILGKGGSGKSSISWLISNYLSIDKKIQTLAIDGDHNMDLTSCLGVNIDKTKFFKDFNTEFRANVGMKKIGMWKEYFDHPAIQFKYPNEPRLTKYITKINLKLDLIVAGLGDEDLMLSNKCSHALSAPIKYMIPTLELQENSWIVLDSVAGSDMLNYGLYFGFDLLCVVVEGHINSIKVANQLKVLTNKQGLRLHFILNKYNINNKLIQDFEKENNEFIISKIPVDLGVLDYDYTTINTSTKDALNILITNISKLSKVKNAYENLKKFELAKI